MLPRYHTRNNNNNNNNKRKSGNMAPLLLAGLIILFSVIVLIGNLLVVLNLDESSGSTSTSLQDDVRQKMFRGRGNMEYGALQHGVGEVYLTFDDGPLDSTLDVLDILSELNVKATFFINGVNIFNRESEANENNALQVQALMRLVHDEHVIANHSFDHMSHNSPGGHVMAFKDVDVDVEFFHYNTKKLREIIKENARLSQVQHNDERRRPPHPFHKRQTTPNLGNMSLRRHGPNAPQILFNNDKLDSIARLPYTNAFRLDHLKSDCHCCTRDDLDSDCSLENPSHSGTQSVLLADKLQSNGMEVYGWDLEWGPESWEENPADTLVSAEDLAEMVMKVSKMDPCIQLSEVTFCDPDSEHQKVIILTHDHLFKDGNSGHGSKNLPQLRHFIRLMKSEGFAFKTLDQYGHMKRDDIREVA